MQEGGEAEVGDATRCSLVWTEEVVFHLPSEFKDEVMEGFNSVQQLVSSPGAEILNPCL